jgi:hypothetical protein
MYFINENDEKLYYDISKSGAYIWPYSKPLDKFFLYILEENKVSSIEFKPSFNFSISGLPSCINSIIFSLNSDFNQPLDNLPSSLKYLELYDKFNQPLDLLPEGLKRLIINAEFNYPLDNLPAGLEYLEIRGAFNHPINNLPLGLKQLRIKNIGDYDDYNTRIAIQRNITTTTQFNQPVIKLPQNIEVIECSHSIFNADNLNKYVLNSFGGIKNIYREYSKLHTISINY